MKACTDAKDRADDGLLYSDDLVEVRLLGPLQVRRRDGSFVDNRDLRTGKTADLLRLLALGDGEPVRVDRLLEELWPDVDETRGRASLRTAASQLRAVLGADTVDRRSGGLVLVRAWVDVPAYERLAHEAHRLLSQGGRAAGVRTAHEAEALRLGDLSAHEVGARWICQARAVHQTTRMQLLLGASTAALELSWLADATDLAATALEQDPASEQATRTLMRAQARLGAGASALRAFERCRQVLADDLGVDPSPQTRALHVELLTGLPAEPGADPHADAPALCRRETGALVELVVEAVRAATPLTVNLSGDCAPERLRLMSEVCATAGSELVTADDVDTGLAAVARQAHDALPSGGRVVYVEVARDLPAGDEPAPRVVLVLGSQRPLRSPACTVVELAPLLPEELHALAEQVLGDRPGPALLAELAARAGGSHGKAVATMRRWLREGHVHSSGLGMVLVDDKGAAERAAMPTMLARTIGRLSEFDLKVLTTLAVLDLPSSTDQLVPLLYDTPEPLSADDRQDLQRSFGQLCDLGLARSHNGRVVLRDALLADTIRSWLRSSILTRRHRRIAERGLVTSAERIRHWLAVGERELACAAALEAAGLAVEQGRHDDARSHLLQVGTLADVHIDLSADVIGWAEQLSGVLALLGHEPSPGPAAQALDEVGLDPVAVSSPATARLHHLPRGPGHPGAQGAHLAGLPGPRWPVHDAPHLGTVTELVTELTAGPPDRRGARQANQLPDAALPALARQDGPGRALSGHLVELLLGQSLHAEHGLRRMRADLPADTDPALSACVDLLLLVAAHDLGRHGTGTSWPDLESLARQAGPDWSWASGRVLCERHDLCAAAALDADGALPVDSELGRQLQLLTTAMLRSAQDDPDGAVEALGSLVRSGVGSGCTLLLPEAAARLATETAPRDPAGAYEHFDVFEWSTGAEGAGPRASTLRLLGRAALRSATGNHRRAAVAAGQAAQLAAASRLVPLAARAQLDRARYLAADGSSEAVPAMALARETFRRSGIVPTALPGSPTVLPSTVRGLPSQDDMADAAG